MNWINVNLPIEDHKKSIKIIQYLASGASSQVYKAVDEEGGFYAVKIFHKEKNHALDLKGEFHTLARMNHPNIIKVYEVSFLDEYHYMIMDYFEGQTLGAYLDENSEISVEQTISIIIQIAYALQEVHQKDVVHKDIKPDNILINTQREVRLLDFSLANKSEKDSNNQGVAGNFLFSSPEQSRTLQRPVDHRSDLYSLGVLIFYCLTQKYPYESDSVQKLLHLHLSADIPKAKFFRGDISINLDICISKLLQKDPDNRYQNCLLLIEDLKSINSVQGNNVSKKEKSFFLTEQLDHNAIIGRHVEILQIHETTDSLSDEDSSAVILLEGESGSGKSRIVWEYLNQHKSSTKNLFLFEKCHSESIASYSVLQKALHKVFVQLDLCYKKEFFNQIKSAQVISTEDLYHFDPRIFLEFKTKYSITAHSSSRSLESISEMFIILCDLFEQTVIFIDDVQWIDPMTTKVLTRVISRKSQSRTLFLASSRNEPEYKESIHNFKKNHKSKIKLNLEIGSFSDNDSKNYINRELGYKDIDQEIYYWILNKTKGNPFAIKEYLYFFLEKNIIFFHWGRWKISSESMNKMNLPDNIVDIVLNRLQSLDEKMLYFVGIMALDQGCVDINLISYLTSQEENETLKKINKLIEKNIIKKNNISQYSFSHDKIFEAAKNIYLNKSLKKIHDEIALYLFDEKNKGDDVSIYRIAHHFKESSLDISKESFTTYFQAGELSLKNNAYDESEEFLLKCLDIEKFATLKEKAYISKHLGFIYFTMYKKEKSLKFYDIALQSKQLTKIEEAEIFQIKSSLYISYFKSNSALINAKKAYEILGFDFSNIIKSLLSLKDPIDLNHKSKIEHVIHHTTVCLGRSSYSNFNKKGMLSVLFWCYLYRRRHKMTETTPRFLASLSVACGSIGLSKLTSRLVETSNSMVKDPYTRTDVLHHTAIGHGILGNPLKSKEMARSNLYDYRRWLNPVTANDSLNIILDPLVLQGKLEEALSVVEDFLTSRTLEVNPAFLHFSYRKNTILSLMGLFKEASSLNLQDYEIKDIIEENKMIHAIFLYYRLLIFFSSNDLHENIDHIEEEWNLKIKQKPRSCLHSAKYYYIALAHARFEICMNQYIENKKIYDNDLLKLKSALKDLKEASQNDFFKLHSAYIEAGLLFFLNKTDECEKIITSLKAESEDLECVWIIASCLRLEAHICRYKQLHEGLQNNIHSCFHMIQKYKMGFLKTRLIREFPILLDHYSSHHSSVLQSHASNYISVNAFDMEKMRLKKYLDALFRISLAASNSNNFNNIMYSCIDEILAALGGERGFIFLFHDEKNTNYGRNSHKETINPESEASTSILQEVKKTQQSVLLANDLESFSSSESIVLQDLKSIIAVPMFLKKKMIGIIYLDSHAVKGIFSQEDAHILKTAASHVAVAVESRRAADLELARRDALKDLEVTGAVQKLLLPKKSHFQYESYSLNSYFQAASQSGGDWWWAQEFDDSLLCLVGDVTGHGPGPAMITASIAGAYQAQTYFYQTKSIQNHIPDMIHSFQKCLYQIGQGEYWMSMSTIFIDSQSNTLTHWSNGSPPPVIIREDGTHIILKNPSNPLGSHDFFLDQGKKYLLKKGDKILMYTDGIYEIQNLKHKMSLGKFKKTVLNWDHSLCGEAIYQKGVNLIKDCLDGSSQDDDITFIVIEVL